MIRFGRNILILFVATSFILGMESVSAETVPVTNQIKITATILPARYVIVDAKDKVLQIISNTSEPGIEPSIYRDSISPELKIPVTPAIASDIDKLLAGKTLKPGVLYDYRVIPIETVGKSQKSNDTNIWKSGIFNLKTVNPTVNLTRL